MPKQLPPFLAALVVLVWLVVLIMLFMAIATTLRSCEWFQ